MIARTAGVRAMVDVGHPGRLRDGYGVGDVFTLSEMYIRKATVVVGIHSRGDFDAIGCGCVWILR